MAESGKISQRYCDVCKEPFAPYSRICPYCAYASAFSIECACVVSPDPFLNPMQLLLDEALQLPIPSFWSGVGSLLCFRGVDSENNRSWSEIISTFETLQSLLLISFDDDDNVMEAMRLMEDMLLDRYERRSKVVTRLRILCGVAIALVLGALIIAIVLLSS